MHLRTLRLLISISGILVLFIYVASLQVSDTLPVHAPDEGQLGGPVVGLTKRQLEKFNNAKAVFERTFSVDEGLGPIFNEQSCATCHSATQTSNKMHTTVWLGKLRSNNKSSADDLKHNASNITLMDFDSMDGAGGPMLIRKSITEQFKGSIDFPKNCLVASSPFPPKDAQFTSSRIPSRLAGLGFIDSLADHAMAWQSNIQKQQKTKVTGIVNSSINPVAGWSPIGRFGDKAQDQTLYQAVARELAYHLGVSSPLYPNTISPPGGLPECIKQCAPADPNDNGKLVAQITYYLALLAPPPRAPVTDAINHGERTFNKLGCAQCHTSGQRTPSKVYVLDPDAKPPIFERSAFDPNGFELRSDAVTMEIKALESRSFNCYSDLLLHDMGPALADGIVQGSARGGEWRTRPLWGLGARSEYLHDGRANTLERAIELHGGEAADSATKFAALPKNVRDNVVAFLKSL